MKLSLITLGFALAASAAPTANPHIRRAMNSPFTINGTTPAANGTVPGVNGTMPVAHSNATSPNTPVSVIAVRSGSPIQYEPLVASDQKFYIGGKSNGEPGGGIPKGDVTVFKGDSLSVAVPGGQKLYVAPDGALGFTKPHHPGDFPAGSSRGPFKYVPGKATGFSSGSWVYGKGGFVACPSSVANEKRYQVFVGNTTGANGEGCLGFEALAQPFSGYTGNSTAAGAYQYV